MIQATPERRHGERGSVLLVVVIGVVVMTILMGQAVQSWNVILQRDREAEFISRAEQIVRAISVYQLDHGRLPNTFEELTKPGPKGNSRYVRKEWKDPLTGEDFVLLWLAPDGASLFRSDGRPSSSGSFSGGGGVPGANGLPGQGRGRNGSIAGAFNVSNLAVQNLGSPGYDPDQAKSNLERYKKATENPVGSGIGQGNGLGQTGNQFGGFGSNSSLNVSGFNFGSDLMKTPGIGPIAGVGTSFTGTPFWEWKGKATFGGYEVSIFTQNDNQQPQKLNTGAPQSNPWEQPGTPIPDPNVDCKFYNTCPEDLGVQPGGLKPQGQGR